MRTTKLPILFSLLLVGCQVKVSVDSKPSETNNVVAIPAAVPVVPAIVVQQFADTIKAEEGTPSGEALGVIDPTNNGFYIQTICGMLKLESETFWFSPELKDGTWGKQTTILILKGNVIAYNIRVVTVGDREVVRLSYWDANKKGWYRDMIGINNGVPFFGNAEGQ